MELEGRKLWQENHIKKNKKKEYKDRFVLIKIKFKDILMMKRLYSGWMRLA